MARNRMIKVDFWADEKTGEKLCVAGKIIFIGMFNFADDSGVVRSDPRYLKASILPYDEAINSKKVEALCVKLIDLGLIIRLFYSGESYFLIKNFLRHQKISRPSTFRHIDGNFGINYLELQGLTEGSLRAHGGLTEGSVPKVKVKVKVKEKGRAKPESPTAVIKTIYDYMNHKLNRNFRATQKNTSSVNARLTEGYSVDDFKQVINIKYAEWNGCKKNEKYLRPETLFGTKFDSYLNQRPAIVEMKNESNSKMFELLEGEKLNLDKQKTGEIQ